MTGSFLLILGFSLLGLLMGAIFSMIPSLHIYNLAGIALIVWTATEGLIPYVAIAPFFLSMVVAFAFLNTLPMTLIGAPDESATVTILPGTKYLMTGRGYEAVILSGIGGLMGLLILVIPAYGIFKMVPVLHKILTPHLHWIIMAVIAYMLMSEWPKGEGIGETIWQRLKHAWSNIFAGLLTFGLSALLGLIVTSRTLVSADAGFQNIMPVFIGLFAFPGILQHLISRENIPAQHIPESIEIKREDAAYSALQGGIAGGLAAYIPAVTAGIGGIIAGHTVARRGDRLFIISGGTAKVIYYVGAFLLLYLVTPLTPGGIGRGGLAIILKPVLQPLPHELTMMMGVVLFTGCLAFLLSLSGAKIMIRLLAKIHYHWLYYISIPVLVILIVAVTGWAGLAMSLVATCIGTIPVFYHCRRSNCMAVLLVPISLNMAGYGGAVLALLGLE